MREHRETTTAAMEQTISRLAGDRASGRAEQDIGHPFWNKRTMLPQANRAFTR